MISTGETYYFTGKNDPLSLLNKIRDGEITKEKAKELQKELNNNIKKIMKRKYDSRAKKSTSKS